MHRCCSLGTSEQRARALRGANGRCDFNGTDNAKPHGMAEVSITLADCAPTLGVDYDEVCIARRVFRSGKRIFSEPKSMSSKRYSTPLWILA